MNRMLVRSLFSLCAISVAAVCVFLDQKADAVTYVRRYPWEVIPPDWVGTWDCNLDGRATVMQLNLVPKTVCNGSLCTTSGEQVAGNFGGVTITQRDYTSSDPVTTRGGHMLPLRYNNTDNWLIMMNTQNRSVSYASGYSTWQNTPFGLQCRKR